MKVLTIRENGELKEEEIGSDLESMQKYVGGYIERIPIEKLEEQGIDLVANEEGKLGGYTPTLALVTKEDDKWRIVDCILGNLFFVSTLTEEEGEWISLNEQQIAFLRANISEGMAVVTVGDEDEDRMKEQTKFLHGLII